MSLSIAKWRDDACSPVLFKIDDLANIYVKKSNNDNLQIGEDWGQCAFAENSMWSFLSKNILDKFPHIKTTFFLVTKERAPMIKDSSYTYNKAINGDENFIEFLEYLQNNPDVELSYHGTTHGTSGSEVKDFKQEWETFKTLEEAKITIAKGKELFNSTVGAYPTGGKYCGYKEGDFGRDSIAQSNFKWWCFHEDNLIWDKNSKDERYTYDLEFIQGVVNIPTTVDASNLSLKIIKKMFTRKYLKSIYLLLKEGKTVEKHLRSLLKNKEVISIYEHTSPYMSNHLIQYPNIVSDIENLNLIFLFLEKEDVWYATCDELANYFIDRSRTSIEMLSTHEFRLLSSTTKEKSGLTLVLPYTGEMLTLYTEQTTFLKEFKLKNNKLYVTHDFEIDTIYKVL